MHLVRIGPHATRHQIAHAIRILRQRAKAASGEEREAINREVDGLVLLWREAGE